MGKDKTPQEKGGLLSGLANLAKDVSGANLAPCPGKTDMGVKCKRKTRPGYGGCGHRQCSSSHGF